MDWLDRRAQALTKRVANTSTIRFTDRLLYTANALKQHPINCEEIDTGS